MYSQVRGFVKGWVEKTCFSTHRFTGRRFSQIEIRDELQRGYLLESPPEALRAQNRVKTSVVEGKLRERVPPYAAST